MSPKEEVLTIKIEGLYIKKNMGFFANLKKHPRELWVLSFTELCERFAFWGVGNLLVVFLLEFYHFSPAKATQLYGIFTGLAASLPVVGGWLGDHWNYQMPLGLGSLLNATGCFLLAIGKSSLLYPALFCMALGYGLFTPSLLAVLSFSYRNTPKLREGGFSIYYALINFGVFAAIFSLSTIAKSLSWSIAFMVAGFVQIGGLIPLFYYFLRHKETYLLLQKTQVKHHENKAPLQKEEKDRLKVIFSFFLITIFFWMTYNQGFTSMEVFVHDFMSKTLIGKSFSEGFFLSSESFFLVVLAPFLASFYLFLQKRKKDPPPSVKTALSLFSMALCFSVMAFASRNIPLNATGAQVFSGYVLFAYFFMAIGELLAAPIGLSMLSKLSPPRYTALFVGLWYLCVGIAFFMGGELASKMNSFGGFFPFFGCFVLLMIVTSLVTLVFWKKLTHLSHFEMDDS